MNDVTFADIHQLVAKPKHGGWFASVHLPTHVPGEQNQQAPMRLKRLLRDLKAALLQRGMDEDGIKVFLAAATRLVDQSDFWKDEGLSVAVLVDADGVKSYHLRVGCNELALVGREFNVIPLIASINSMTPYWLLAVSQNRVRLLRGLSNEIQEVEVSEMPRHGLRALGYDEPQEQSQTHSASPQLPGKQSVVFHGQGGAADAAKAEIVAFFRLVNRAVHRVVDASRMPLIFAGVDYLFPLYSEANTSSRLWQRHVSGNPDRLSSQELCRRAGDLLASSLDERWQTDIDNYWKNATAGRAEKHVEEIVRCARRGLVETLFIDPSVRQWGLFDSDTDHVRIDAERRPDSEDLVNAAAAAVVRHGGTVATVGSGYVPGGGLMAATLRYAAAAPAGRA